MEEVTFSLVEDKKKQHTHTQNLVLSEKTDLQRERKGLMGLRIHTLRFRMER